MLEYILTLTLKYYIGIAINNRKCLRMVFIFYYEKANIELKRFDKSI